MLVNNN